MFIDNIVSQDSRCKIVRYRYRHLETGEIVELEKAIKDRNEMPDKSDKWERVLEAPHFTSASYLDGQKRPRAEGFDKIKQAARLHVEKGDMTDKADRNRIQQEIDKLEKI